MSYTPKEEGSERWIVDTFNALSLADPGSLQGGIRKADGSFEARKIEEIWHEYDVDGNGYLDDQDINSLLINMFPFDNMRSEYEGIGADEAWIAKKKTQFETRLKTLGAHMLRHMDSNSDGVIDKQEFMSFFARVF